MRRNWLDEWFRPGREFDRRSGLPGLIMFTCRVCGATVLDDPFVDDDVLLHHKEWHQETESRFSGD